MPRNMSFMLTQEQYRAQTKTVTRRFGWAFLEVGDLLNGVEKGQGLKKGEKIVRLGQHRPTALRWEPVRAMLDDLEYGKAECIKEGFPDLTPEQFVEKLLRASRGKTVDDLVHRIKYEYIWTKPPQSHAPWTQDANHGGPKPFDLFEEAAHE